MCDTFVALPSVTKDGSLIFGKNSDREPNEAQSLEFHPGRRYGANASVMCTYTEIPQVKETLAVLLSRPFWMWGAEMGANEKGVVIGNEAVFTKMPYAKKGGLTGMDMLRLALERAGTAQQALETVVQLLSDYGQGGICGYQEKMVYHNSFIIAGPNEAWVLETAAHLWAAKKIEAYYSISNGLTIGSEYDRSHPQLIETARKKGWLKKGETFHFARCYSDWFYTTFSACRTRRDRSFRLLEDGQKTFDVKTAWSLLRDHGDGEHYRPDGHFLANHVCAHAANKLSRNSTQTTGSLVAHLNKDRQTYWVTGSAAPCTGVFKPVWFSGEVLPDIGAAPGAVYDAKSLWWRHELLHRSVLIDFEERLQMYRADRDALEEDFLRSASAADSGALFEISRQAFDRAGEQENVWLNRIKNHPVKKQPNRIYRAYWNKQNKKAGIGI